MTTLLLPGDARLAPIAPLPQIGADELRLDRFPPAAIAALAGQIGPLANARSGPQCGVRLLTDSPWIVLRLLRLRHHQPIAQQVSGTVEVDGQLRLLCSHDLREHSGQVEVHLATGLERHGPVAEVCVYLPTVSVAVIGGVELAPGATAIEPAPALAPRWLAIGDSLTQGFSVGSAVQTWVGRCTRAWGMPVWNLGIGGVKIELGAFTWALDQQRWDLVTIALGSNHAWKAADVVTAPERAVALAQAALAGGHGRVVLVLPPWKPCEAGQGPQDFAGVALTAETGERVRQVREGMRAALHGMPGVEMIEVATPHDARLFPDGLHPLAHGSALYAAAISQALGLPTG